MERKAVVEVLVDLYNGPYGDRIFDPEVFPFVDSRLRRLVTMYLDGGSMSSLSTPSTPSTARSLST